MSIIDMLSLPEKYIPHGYYCYTQGRNEPCPFWENKQGEYPHHEDGYCHYLGVSDWDLNEQGSNKKIVYVSDGMDKSLIGQTMEEVFDGEEEIDPISGKKIHFTSSLLWDQVKECEVNMKEPDDTVIIQYDSTTGSKTETTIGEINKGIK